MKVNPEIFRLYDIRGIYPKELDEQSAYQIGRCFVYLLRGNGGDMKGHEASSSRKQKLKIAIAKDIRLSSPALFRGFSAGVLDEGCDIIDLGVITTPMLYFAVDYFNCDGGAIITASHNPNPYNGLKLTREKAIPIGGESGLFGIMDCVNGNLGSKYIKDAKRMRGKITKKNIEKIYLDFNLKLTGIKRGEFKGLSLALDAGNGVGGPITLKVLEKTGVRVYPLYCKPDGSFPHHVPNPILRENLKDLAALVKKKKPDLGLALDGDADRIVFLDEKGKPISGDLITALMAKIILKEKEKHGSKIIYDIRSSRVVAETIKSEGGVPIPYRIGHALIKEKMRDVKAIFGGELVGHYYLGDGLFYEVPLFAVLKILKEIKVRRMSLSELIVPFRKYYHSGEINFEVENKEEKIREIKKRYTGGKILEIDGLRVDFKDWWFLVRPSNTEPLLRLIVEAKTKNLLERRVRELKKIIK